MNPTKILIVDDEPDMRELIRMYLEKDSYTCIEAGDGNEALDLMDKEHFDLIILDIMMPELDGITFTMKVREHSNIPIIFLTARGDEWDKVYGLKIGADDYIVKPFSPTELSARVQAVLRRTQAPHMSDGKFEKHGPIEVNESGRKVKNNGEVVSLTLKEFDLLQFFIKHEGQVLSREQLLEKIWGYEYIGSVRTVDTHVKTLRLKLGDSGKLIQTVWGIGYKFEV